MLKCEIIPYVQLKPTWLIVNLYAINKHDLQPNMSTTDDISYPGGAHVQQSFRKSLLNLIGSESHTQVFVINFTR